MRANVLILIAASAAGLMGCKASSLPDGGAPSLDLCGLTCPPDTTDGGGGTDTTDGGTTDTISGGTDPEVTSGDATIALESSVLKSPEEGSVSELEIDTANKTASIGISTGTKTSAAWPVKKTMDLYQEGIDATNQPGLGGIGAGNYEEYRKLSTNESGQRVDEELQVWNFGNSYGTQYRDASNGGEAAHQAWSFGGDKSPGSAVNAGKATYAGRFGSTAKSENWVEPNNQGRTIAINNLWRVNGRTNASVNFDNGTIDATLTPENWNAFQTKGNASGFATVNASNTSDPNYVGFMDDRIKIKGTIDGDSYTGIAKLVDPEANPALNAGWVSGDNPVYGGFFGKTANETTGIFAVQGVSPDPIGGDLPINDDRRGFLHHSGVFNGKCVNGANSKCKP